MKISSLLALACIIVSDVLAGSLVTVPCHWPANTSSDTSPEFAAQTGVTSYSLQAADEGTFTLKVEAQEPFDMQKASLNDDYLLSFIVFAVDDFKATFVASDPTVVSVTVYDPLA